MPTNHWILYGTNNDGALIDGYPKSKIKNYRYAEGEPLTKEFPKKATVSFSKKWPDRRKLYDFLDNTCDLLIVSSRVRGLLEQLEAKALEFLPLTVLDHKDKPVAEPYFILNPLGGQDIIDMEKSKVVMNTLNPGQIAHINKLVPQPEKVEPGAKLFRASRALRVFFVDADVREAFRKNKVTGYYLFKAKGWNGLPFGDEDT
jgi:hypothetical protein